MATLITHILHEMNLTSLFRPREHSPVWHAAPPHWRRALASSVKHLEGNPLPPVFFRADDIGAGGRAFNALCEIFRAHQIPLGMAVVPAWLSDVRAKQLFSAAPREESLWAWHQHGWRHVNWERAGKKSEFGEQRPIEKQWRDIQQGKQKMLDIFGNQFVNVFTPPWNRLSGSTLRILQELGFEGVSMGKYFPRGLRPPLTMKNLRVNLDLHTRKEKDSQKDYRDMLEELAALLGRREPVGIMIHHQKMTYFAFEFLDELLVLLKSLPGIQFVSFQEILDQEDEK